MQVFAPITVLALAVKMPFPELGVEHEAPRVLRANRTRGDGTAVSSAGAAARSNASPGRADGESFERSSGTGARGRLGARARRSRLVRDDNLQIEWRGAGDDPALFQRYAAELAALSPDASQRRKPPCCVIYSITSDLPGSFRVGAGLS